MAATQSISKSEQPAPFVADPIPERMKSKMYQPSDLPVGQSVFYRGERYYIESVPPSWDYSAHVYISDRFIDPNAPADRLPPKDRMRFGVHPDLLSLAPTTKNRFTRQPTQAAVEARAKREATGVSDAGDAVADVLRGKNLDEVYAVAAAFLGVDELELRDKYGRLNPGQQRMNCGNRMRNHYKKLERGQA